MRCPAGAGTPRIRPSHRFSGSPEARSGTSRINQKGLFRQNSKPEIPLKSSKYSHITEILKTRSCNSPKNATSKKPTCQNGLRSEKYARYEEIGFQVFSGPFSVEEPGRFLLIRPSCFSGLRMEATLSFREIIGGRPFAPIINGQTDPPIAFCTPPGSTDRSGPGAILLRILPATPHNPFAAALLPARFPGSPVSCPLLPSGRPALGPVLSLGRFAFASLNSGLMAMVRSKDWMASSYCPSFITQQPRLFMRIYESRFSLMYWE